MYDKLVNQVNSLVTSGLVLETRYNTNKSGLGKEIDSRDKEIT